jgi:secreted PhoX family phosphatase
MCFVVCPGADFVHLFDLCSGPSPRVQTIDVFGEITGATLSPDDSTLFIAVTDAVYGQTQTAHKQKGAADMHMQK